LLRQGVVHDLDGRAVACPRVGRKLDAEALGFGGGQDIVGVALQEGQLTAGFAEGTQLSNGKSV
jgi:hypothetical protein